MIPSDHYRRIERRRITNNKNKLSLNHHQIMMFMNKEVKNKDQARNERQQREKKCESKAKQIVANET